jgi:hypothetical protein
MKSIEAIKRDNAPTLRVSLDLELPLDAVTQKIAWLGRTGSGKTFACKRMVEQMLRLKAQVIILDGVGVWPGLRLGPKRFDIPVLGGLYGDIPLEPTAGALVADVIVDRGTSIVLDVSQMLDSERTRFATAFAQRFFQRKKAAPSAVHLVLEECQDFVPENNQHGEERMLHEFQRIAKQGRSFGIGVSFLSQRPQEVSKKALNQAECVFAFQMTGPQERKALQYWLSDKGFDGKLADILPHLEIGTPHVWSPQWLKVSKVVRILPIETLDTSSTPKVGEMAFAQKKLEPIDLKELTVAMTETVERAKQDDPKALRARISELEKELKKNVGAPTTKVVERTVEVPGFEEQAFAELFESVTTYADNIAAVATDVKSNLGKSLNLYRRQVSALAKGARPILPKAAHPQTADVPKAARPPGNHEANYSQSWPNVPKAPNGEAKLGRCPSAILKALAQRYPRPSSASQAAILSGYSVTSSTFHNGVSSLRTSGLVDGPGKELRLTDAGVIEAGPVEQAPDLTERIRLWGGKVGGCSRALLESVWGNHPRPITREDLAEVTGYSVTSSTFQNGLSTLRVLDLIVSDRGGPVSLSEELSE